MSDVLVCCSCIVVVVLLVVFVCVLCLYLFASCLLHVFAFVVVGLLLFRCCFLGRCFLCVAFALLMLVSLV